jgi:hypothetical protein
MPDFRCFCCAVIKLFYNPPFWRLLQQNEWEEPKKSKKKPPIPPHPTILLCVFPIFHSILITANRQTREAERECPAGANTQKGGGGGWQMQ